MPTTTNRETSPRSGDSVNLRLARLLDTPLLAQVVPHLAPETLHQLIHIRGLEACGELVTAATPAQLTSLLDLDLWGAAPPGRDGRFDVDRFGDWLEVLVDSGDSVAARTVAALDPDVVIAGLSRYLRVFDPGTFEPTEATDDERLDRHDLMNSETSGDEPECEVGGYLVRARRTDAWDAIVTLLVTLDSEQPQCFHAVMQGCRRLSHSRAEVDELDDLLVAPDQHFHDVTIARERRRSQQGYATPADARAFLQMARHPRVPAAATRPRAMNPLAAAYFRAADDDMDKAPGAPAVATPAARPGRGDDVTPTIDAIISLLAEAGTAPERPRGLLGAAHDDPRGAQLPVLGRLMEGVRDHDAAVHLARGRDLAFLANVLLSGGSVQSRPFTPQEASEAAAAVCNLGLECWPGRDGATPPDTFLVDHDLVTAFEVGWAVVHVDVSLFVADHLVSALADLECADADIRRGLRALRRQLATHREGGRPWLARDAADVLALLDMPVWIGVLGLLDECPILPTAVTAVLERRTTSVSPTAFAFIGTTAQIGDVRLFMRALPGLLSR